MKQEYKICFILDITAMDMEAPPSPIGREPLIQGNSREDLFQGIIQFASADMPSTPSLTPSFSITPSPMDTSEGPNGEDGRSGQSVSPFCFVEAIRQTRPISAIEAVRKELGSRPGAEGAYTLADALKYAVLYGHVEYSSWLLTKHAAAALDAPVCCPLLLTAVRLDRADMVEQLCRLSRQVKTLVPYIDR